MAVFANTRVAKPPPHFLTTGGGSTGRQSTGNNCFVSMDHGPRRDRALVAPSSKTAPLLLDCGFRLATTGVVQQGAFASSRDGALTCEVPGGTSAACEEPGGGHDGARNAKGSAEDTRVTTRPPGDAVEGDAARGHAVPSDLLGDPRGGEGTPVCGEAEPGKLLRTATCGPAAATPGANGGLCTAAPAAATGCAWNGPAPLPPGEAAAADNTKGAAEHRIVVAGRILGEPLLERTAPGPGL